MTTGGTAGSNYSYSGPGSFYQVEFDSDGNFGIRVSTAVGEDPWLSTTGTYERLETGFLLMTFDEVDTNVSGEGPSVGQQAIALEVPGYALFLEPLDDTADEIIPMLVSGSCPTDDFTANWISAQVNRVRDASSPDADWWGTFEYTHGDPAMASVETKYNLVDLELVEQGQDVLEEISCQDGMLQVMDGSRPVANIWLTQGGAMVETFEEEERDATIFAMNAEQVSLDSVAGTYAAFVLPGLGREPDMGAGGAAGMGGAGNDGDGGGDPIFPARVTLEADGSGLGEQLIDVTTGEIDEGTVTFTLGEANDPSAGFIKASMENDEGSDAPLVCTASLGAGDTERKMLFCLGQSPGEPEDRYTLLMVSVD